MKARTRAERRRRKKASSADFVAASNGQVELVSNDADNPFSYGSGNPMQQIKVLKNRRSSPCTEYRNRQLITHYQEQAANTFEATYARSKATVQAMDTAKEPVDGGSISGAMADGAIDAIKDLIGLHQAMGAPAYLLLEQVCGHGVYVNDMARHTRERSQMMAQLREALDCAAVYWGYLRPARLTESTACGTHE